MAVDALIALGEQGTFLALQSEGGPIRESVRGGQQRAQGTATDDRR